MADRLILVLLFLCWSTAKKLCSSQQPRDDTFLQYNVGVLMASHLDSPFDLERCGPAVDMALQEVNDKFLAQHAVKLRKVQER
jgi:hypothetical protein